MEKSFKGIITALATPFSDGELDVASFRNLLKQQIDAGVHGFVINGTTGESPTLEVEEVKRLLDVASSDLPETTPIIVGTGSNCTRTTIEATKRAESWGADAALVVVPYYNKPTQDGLVAHFRSVAESTKLPIVLYNVPGRTIVSMTKETIVELAAVENIIGIKEASGDLDFFKEIRTALPENFVVLSGDDPTWAEMSSLGGDGVISVISHLIPNSMVELLANGTPSLADAKTWNDQFRELMDRMYAESNPIGVKMGLKKMEIFDSAELRLPLVEMSGAGSDQLGSTMKGVGIIS